MISEDDMTVWVMARDGASIHRMMPSGAPAFTAASRMTFAAAMVEFLALGCGEKMMAFLVFKAKRALKMVVEVGFVVGITAATTPIGSATFWIPKERSSSMTPQVLSFLYWL